MYFVFLIHVLWEKMAKLTMNIGKSTFADPTITFYFSINESSFAKKDSKKITAHSPEKLDFANIPSLF